MMRITNPAFHLAAAEAFAQTHRHDHTAYQRWARGCPEPVRAYFRAIREQSLAVHPRHNGSSSHTSHDGELPPLASFSPALQELLEVCWTAWRDVYSAS